MNEPKTIAELLNARRYDPNRQPIPEQVVLRINGRRVGSVQNIITLSGKQKQGKSRYLAAIAAAAITGADIFSISVAPPSGRNRVAIFDTEQGEYDFYRQIEQVKKIAGVSHLPAFFDAYTCREDSPVNILKMVNAYLTQHPDCALLFLDGILDLLLDFNNVAESKRLANFLKRISKQHNCLIVGVMHRGKGNDTSIGNIGSMIDRLAQSVLKVEKTEAGTFRLAAEFMRSDIDFDPVEIYHNGQDWQQVYGAAPGVEIPPAPVRKIMPRPQEIEPLEHRQNVETIFSSIGDFITYDQLIKGIKELYGVGRNWAVDCCKHLRFEGLIFHTGDGWTNKRQTKIKTGNA